MLVADEVVVDHEDRSSPLQPVQGVELGQDLVRRLGAGHLAVELDDVAEFAVERASAGELHAHRVVALQVDEVEARNRCSGHVGLPRLPVHGVRGAVRQVAQEFGKDLLGLVQHEVGHAFDLVVKGGGMRTSGHHRDTGPVAPRDDVHERGALHDHRGREHHVGPFEVRVLQRRHIHVHDAEGVLRREHRGDGEQPQRRKGRLHARQVQRKVIPPVGRRQARVDQQCVLHGRFLRVRRRQSIASTAPDSRPFAHPLHGTAPLRAMIHRVTRRVCIGQLPTRDPGASFPTEQVYRALIEKSSFELFSMPLHKNIAENCHDSALPRDYRCGDDACSRRAPMREPGEWRAPARRVPGAGSRKRCAAPAGGNRAGPAARRHPRQCRCRPSTRCRS